MRKVEKSRNGYRCVTVRSMDSFEAGREAITDTVTNPDNSSILTFCGWCLCVSNVGIQK